MQHVVARWPHEAAEDDRDRFVAVLIEDDLLAPRVRRGHRVIVDLGAVPVAGDLALLTDGCALVVRELRRGRGGALVGVAVGPGSVLLGWHPLGRVVQASYAP